ncbi:MAG: hypothetical protein MK188_02165 [Gammaproteobacteria bacterium]|nr:hypothetical protein [Gammaproteobacteria bacterium]
MKNLIKSVLVVAAVSLSFNASAENKTDADNLADCKQSVRTQFDDVSKIKVASINSRRNLFKAKLRVTSKGERAMVACEIRGEEPVALSCLKGAACEASTIASN